MGADTMNSVCYFNQKLVFLGEYFSLMARQLSNSLLQVALF